jgi:D-xylose 1-dehydrogenase (NADP+, D-xylono-1,5-lactone-forming)
VIRVRWGLLSTASIGRLVVGAARRSAAARFVAVASRDAERARQFAGELGLEHAFGSYEALLASDRVDAVYIALPNAMHTEWTVAALAAGKHVLCEKPFALSPGAARQAADAAAAARLVCAEGFMYRYHPQTRLARQLVADGAIGGLRHIRAALSRTIPAGDIRRDPALGGGAALDLGCYCVSAARLFGGNPERTHAEAVRDASGVDVRLAATMRLAGGVLAQLDVGMDLPARDELELIGTGGAIVLSDPWLCRSPTLALHRDGHTEHLPVDPAGTYRLARGDDVYRIELDAVSAAIAGREPLPFGPADAVDQAEALAQLLASAARATPAGALGPRA